MTNPSGFSDSQESLKSVLLDDATFHELQEDVRRDGIEYLLDGNVMETEQKCILMNEHIMEEDQKCVLMYGQPQQQHQHMNIPVPNEYAGDYNFRLTLTPTTGKHCVYSELLQKMYINMGQTLPLRFEWKPAVGDLWVRTTMVFALDQYRGDPVIRCHNHMATPDGSGHLITPDVVKHVVRCIHPESHYVEMGGHLSVLAPLGTPQAGASYVPLNFQFHCKNSCTSGMNRRPTELVFTLETRNGQVLGRRRLAVRVCSCPKRDKEKEELEQQTGKIHVGGGKKRKLNNAPPPPGKKLASGSADTREYLVQFKIPGKENCQAVLKYAYDLMAGQAMRTGQHEAVRPYMDNLNHMIHHSQ